MTRPALRPHLLRCTAAAALATVMVVGAGGARAQTALPTGGTVTTGTATISNDSTSLTVTQTSNRATINFTTFDVAQGNSVAINQPDATAATLARVTGGTSSTIAGSVSATGTLYLVNPNGIAITSTGAIRTGGGFVASTLNITDENFNASTSSFTGGTASAKVGNAGSISANGFAALLGGTVSNGGTISVPAGQVGLASGEAVTLDINGANFLSVTMPTAATTTGETALIENAGTITGRRVELTGASAADAVRNIVNVGGTINADSASGNGGTILLSATGGGRVSAQGSVTARATGPTGNGGTITLSGGTVTYAPNFADTTAAGGATGTTVLNVRGNYSDSVSGRPSSLLATTNLSIIASGTITTPFIGWQSGNALSLMAGGDIALGAISGLNGTLNLSAGGGVANTGTITNVNGVGIGLFTLTNGNWAQNAATLPSFVASDFRFSQSNATFLRVTGGDGGAATPYRIADVYGLQGVASSNQQASSFALAGNIDASGSANWNAGAGFVPIGTDGAGNVWNGTAFAAAGASSIGFTGTLDGGGFTVSGLNAARGDTNYVGLIGWMSSGTVRDLTVGGTLGGFNDTGLIGHIGAQGATVTNVVSNLAVTGGGQSVGGLIGNAEVGTITNARTTGAINGAALVGGLIGASGAITVTGSSASGNVTGTGGGAGLAIGGLIGATSGGTIDASFASGVVTSNTTEVGGLIGTASGGARITGSSASGAVTATGANVGGLVGALVATSGVTSTIANSFATGAVTAGGGNGGGLVGGQLSSGGGTTSIAASYATGAVVNSSSSSINYGGLVGRVSTDANGASRATVDSTRASGEVTATRGGTNTGGLIGNVGSNNSAQITITGSSASGAVSAVNTSAGGLIGSTGGPVSLRGVSASGNVSGSSAVGGLVGTLSTSGSIVGGFATGNVSATSNNVGGLVGNVSSATVAYVFATGNVSSGSSSSSSNVGGLVGQASGSGERIVNAYATGAVSGGTAVGGLVGNLLNSASVRNVYATGSAQAGASTGRVGGLIGQAFGSNTVDGAWASGAVTGTTPGGLIGTAGNTVTVSKAYWDSFSTGRTNAIGSGTLAGSPTAVTSNPNAAGGATAFTAASYANLPGATNMGSATVSGFAFLPGNQTRPFLAFEVPVAGNPLVATTNGAQTIVSAHQLQLVNGYLATYDATAINGATLAARYTLPRDVDLAETGRAAAGTAASRSGMWSAAGFVPLGTNGAGLTWDGTTYRSIGMITSGIYGFSGSLTGAVADGPNRVLANLFINRVGVNNTGLFGTLSGTVTNLALTGVAVTGGNGTGALAGMTIGGPVNSDVGTTPRVTLVSAAGRVTGAQVVGGLIGSAGRRTTVRAGSFNGDVTGTNTVGGLVGYANGATIDGSTAGSVTGRSYVGGAIGYQFGGNSTVSSASTVTGTLAVGGVIGVVDGGTASALTTGNTVSGPSSADRNYGRVQNGGTVRSPTP